MWKTIEDQGIKQVEALKTLKLQGQDIETTEWLFPKKIRYYKTKNEIDEI